MGVCEIHIVTHQSWKSPGRMGTALSLIETGKVVLVETMAIMPIIDKNGTVHHLEYGHKIAEKLLESVQPFLLHNYSVLRKHLN